MFPSTFLPFKAIKLLLVSLGSALLLTGAAPRLGAQSFTAAQPSSPELAGVFAKAKDTDKTKDGAGREAAARTPNEPWVLETPGSYAGTYEVPGLGFVLTLETGPAGELVGRGEEPAADGLSPARPVTLRDVRIQNGLLTATKVDEFGLPSPFSASFLTQSRNGEVSRGLGTELSQPMELNGLVLKKLFYQKQR